MPKHQPSRASDFLASRSIGRLALRNQLRDVGRVLDVGDVRKSSLPNEKAEQGVHLLWPRRVLLCLRQCGLASSQEASRGQRNDQFAEQKPNGGVRVRCQVLDALDDG